MTVVTRMWWVRHAPVPDDGRIYGASDVAADTGDAACFAALAAVLPRDACWVTSHLRRARQTAAAIADAGLPIGEPLEERALGEQDFGEWQGQEKAHVFASDEARRFWLAPASTRPPGGESFADLTARVQPAILRLVESHPGRDLCIVAHAGTIRAAVALALGLTAERALSLAVGNCSVTRLDHIAGRDGAETAWRIVWVNRPAL